MKGCKFPGCENEHRAKGYCAKHWMRWRVHGTPYLPKQLLSRLCQVTYCMKKYFALGFCMKHHRRFYKYGNPFFIKTAPHGSRKGAQCLVHDCERPVDARGYCRPHYERVRLRGHPVNMEGSLELRSQYG